MPIDNTSCTPRNQQQLLFTTHPSWNTLKAMKGLILSPTPTHSQIKLISTLTCMDTLTGIMQRFSCG